MRKSLMAVLVLSAAAAAAQQAPNPRQQPGAAITMYAPDQHDLYDGHFVMSANRIYMVGGLNDPEGWDHLDNAAAAVTPVAGTAEIDVNDVTNSGKFEARLKIPDGDLVLAIDRFHEFNPCQNGGIVGFLHEHGTDSGCGDNNWPKTFVYPGWMGIRSCHAERQAVIPRVRDALHDHARHPRSENPESELSNGGQEATRW